MLTPEQKFEFDLNGYIILKKFIPEESLSRMNKWIDNKALSDPNFEGKVEHSRLWNPFLWDIEFRRLLSNSVILNILSELIGPYFRLDENYALFLKEGYPGLPLHGADPKLDYDPIINYNFRNGKIFSGFTSVTYTLKDVSDNEGGFAVIPGSHKVNIKVPEKFLGVDDNNPFMKRISLNAGDCVIFTEALTHGTLPWRGKEDRRTLFFKYTPCGVTWSRYKYMAPEFTDMPNDLELSEVEKILLQSPSASDHRIPVLGW